jgi:hypothetical protein
MHKHAATMMMTTELMYVKCAVPLSMNFTFD